MIISDLNYLEVVSEASSIEGGNDYNYVNKQTIDIKQAAAAAAGNNGGSGISIGNVATALNLAIPTQIGVSVLSAG
jgi:hypothetical protein